MEEFLKLFNLRDILLHIANTLILFVAIRLLVYKPVRKFLDARAQRVNAEMQAAADKRGEAESALEAAKATRSEAELAATQAQAEGVRRAQETGDEVLAVAREQADEILRKAQAEAEHIRTTAQEEIQQQALVMAVEIAEKMIGRELAASDNETLAREFLTKVG